MAKLSQSRNRRNAGFICLLVSMAKILQAVEHRDIVAAAIVRVREKKKKAETKVDNKEPDVSKPAAILEDQPGAEPDRTGRDAAARATGETESAAPAPRAEPARAAGAEESGADTAGPRPEVEVGPHGPILRQFRHDPTGAIDALLKAHTGDAVGALYNPHVGEVDIVWGETAAKGFGLAHILEGHPEPGLLSEFARVFESMTIGPRRDTRGNKIALVSASHTAVVRTEWRGTQKTWLLTFFRETRPGMEKGTEGVDGGPGPVQPADDIASRHGNLYSSYHNIGMSAIHFSRPILNGTGFRVLVLSVKPRKRHLPAFLKDAVNPDIYERWLDRTARVEGSKLPPVQMANQRRKE
jgi:hypothetical protein